MDKSILVKMFGFRAALLHGDTLVLDRWLWLKRRLPKTFNGEKLIDIGCGSGAFSIGAALRGYTVLGLSWDERNNKIATERAKICKANECEFEILDVRKLYKKKEFFNKFDVVVNFENIEHVLDDKKLFQDMALCLKPGGRLLLTTPYFLYKSITGNDNGPFSKTEDGGHVRRGYTESMLKELCEISGLKAQKITFCSGVFSQKITGIQRVIGKIHPFLGWVVILPFRILPFVFDGFITKFINWPFFSICLEAYKPRFKKG
jgi:SAM-dependent methyltransferase